MRSACQRDPRPRAFTRPAFNASINCTTVVHRGAEVRVFAFTASPQQEERMSTIESILQENRVFPPSPEFVRQANIAGMDPEQAREQRRTNAA